MKARIKTPAPKFKCDSCGVHFEIKLNETLYDSNKNDKYNRRWTFSCPNCGREYEAYDGKKEAGREKERDERGRRSAAEMLGEKK